MWGFELRREIEVPLKRQIYLAIKEQIVAGKLRAGEALPSTRQLAEELKISRNTVNEAFDMLLAEGFVVSRQGAPTRITEGVAVHTEKKRLLGSARNSLFPSSPISVLANRSSGGSLIICGSKSRSRLSARCLTICSGIRAPRDCQACVLKYPPGCTGVKDLWSIRWIFS